MSSDFIDIKHVLKSISDCREQRSEDGRCRRPFDNGREFVCILGPSGCGKSTLLNMVAGFERPTTGEIRCARKLVERPGADRGIVFQEHTLFEWMTVRENVLFGLTCNPQIKRQVADPERRAQECIDLVGLTGFEATYRISCPVA